jgi:hypothetical protein
MTTKATTHAKAKKTTKANLTDTGNAQPKGAQLNGINFDEWLTKVAAAKTMNEKRAILKDISAIVKPLVKNDFFESVNEAIISLFYERGENIVFHSYRDWQGLGFQVKRGVTAFPIWGRPKSELLKDKGEQLAPEENDFHPVALIFSNTQVYPITTKE